MPVETPVTTTESPAAPTGTDARPKAVDQYMVSPLQAVVLALIGAPTQTESLEVSRDAVSGIPTFSKIDTLLKAASATTTSALPSRSISPDDIPWLSAPVARSYEAPTVSDEL